MGKIAKNCSKNFSISHLILYANYFVSCLLVNVAYRYLYFS